MCKYLQEPVLLPAREDRRELDGIISISSRRECFTHRQVGEVDVKHNNFFANAFIEFEDQCLDDVDLCLIPLIEELHRKGRPTQASCCGHYEKSPWITVFIPPTKEIIEDTLAIIKSFHPEWDEFYPHLECLSQFWIQNKDKLDDCSWAIGYHFLKSPCFKYTFNRFDYKGNDDCSSSDDIDDFIGYLKTEKYFFTERELA